MRLHAIPTRNNLVATGPELGISLMGNKKFHHYHTYKVYPLTNRVNSSCSSLTMHTKVVFPTLLFITIHLCHQLFHKFHHLQTYKQKYFVVFALPPLSCFSIRTLRHYDGLPRCSVGTLWWTNFLCGTLWQCYGGPREKFKKISKSRPKNVERKKIFFA